MSNPSEEQLGARIRSGFLFTAATQVFQSLLSLATAMVLARLLNPDDYGLLGMVMVVVGLCHIVNDSGLGLATVQKKSISDDELTNVFWLQLGLSGAVGLLVLGGAPFIAEVYGEPRLTGIFMAFSPFFLLVGLSSPYAGLLYRELRYERVAKFHLLSAVVGSAAAVSLALAGAGVWALVTLRSLPYLVLLVALLTTTRWRPGWPKRGTAMTYHLRFGRPYLGSRLVEFGTTSLDRFLLGRWFGAVTLGLYERGSTVLETPLRQISAPLNQVVFPALAKAQDDPLVFRRIFLQNFRVLCWLSLPAVGLIVPCAEDLVLILLGPKWMEATQLFLYSSVAAALTPIVMTRKWILLSRGWTDRLLRLEVGSSAVLLVLLVATASHGPEALALVRSGWMVLMVFVSLHVAFIGTGLRMLDAIGQARGPAAVGLLIASVGLLPLELGSPILRLMLHVVAGALIAALVGALSGDLQTLYRLRRAEQSQHRATGPSHPLRDG